MLGLLMVLSSLVVLSVIGVGGYFIFKQVKSGRERAWWETWWAIALFVLVGLFVMVSALIDILKGIAA